MTWKIAHYHSRVYSEILESSLLVWSTTESPKGSMAAPGKLSTESQIFNRSFNIYFWVTEWMSELICPQIRRMKYKAFLVIQTLVKNTVSLIHEILFQEDLWTVEDPPKGHLFQVLPRLTTVKRSRWYSDLCIWPTALLTLQTFLGCLYSTLWFYLVFLYLIFPNLYF